MASAKNSLFAFFFELLLSQTAVLFTCLANEKVGCLGDISSVIRVVVRISVFSVTSVYLVREGHKHIRRNLKYSFVIAFSPSRIADKF